MSLTPFKGVAARGVRAAAAALALLAAGIGAAAAATGAAPFLDLSRYTLAGNYAIDTLDGLGLEASAVTYAGDRGSLFVVGDEGLGVVELSLTGQTLSTMRFSGWPAASTNHDAEGLAYLGQGRLVVIDERLQDAYRFDYVAGGSVNLANAPWVSFGGNAGNLGAEGISYDARDGSFVTVKQDNPQALLAGGLSFAVGGGVSTMVPLFDADAVLGLASLSDVMVLSGVNALAGTAAADHLLVLSLDSRRLIEIDRSGRLYSSMDLSGLTTQAIEGVTIDERGVIYLVAEDSGTPNSRLIVLNPLSPVPEPATLALMLAGLAVLRLRARRR